MVFNLFIDSLPEEARSKCALCNETLTHIVKQAEAQTGAPTLTVCRAIADSHNATAAPADTVTPKQLDDRARYHEGRDKIGISENSDQDDPVKKPNTTEPKPGAGCPKVEDQEDLADETAA